MVMVDYIIVGSGLAGISFAENALLNDKTILVFNNDSQNSSKIAGGLYNPVILKRFSEVWQAQEQWRGGFRRQRLVQWNLRCRARHSGLQAGRQHWHRQGRRPGSPVHDRRYRLWLWASKRFDHLCMDLRLEQ